MIRSRKAGADRSPMHPRGAGPLCLAASAAALLLVVGLAGPAGTARAQSDSDLQRLIERVDRLQRDIDTLQANVYRGKVPPPSSGVTATPPAAVAGNGGSSNLVANMQVRLDDLESQMQALTGQIQETNHSVTELDRKLEKLTSDIDLRLKALENSRAASSAGTTQGPAGAEAGQPSSQTPSADGQKPGVLGTLSRADLEQQKAGVGAGTPAGTPSSAPQQQATATAPALPKGSPATQYKYATGLLFKTDYTGAERAFKAFLEAHPYDKLAGNAQYWLGETYYARGEYAAAAHAFADGYQKYPKSSKGPDNLLKLGMSLKALDKKPQACETFKRLSEDFPNAPERIKSHSAAERKALGC